MTPTNESNQEKHTIMLLNALNSYCFDAFSVGTSGSKKACKGIENNRFHQIRKPPATELLEVSRK
eukprot:2137545-Amphidinium_carterae.1